MTTLAKMPYWCLAVMLSSTCIAACSNSSSPSNANNPPPAPPLNVTFRWTDSPELQTPDGVFIRGFDESLEARRLTGKNASLYPGFWNAVLPNIFTMPFDDDPKPSHANLPTEFFSIRGVTTLPDGRGQISICEWEPYSRRLTEQDSGREVIFTYQRSGKAPDAKQSGSAPRPSRNVFGDWKITSYDDMINHGQPEELSTCRLQIPNPPPTSGSPALPPSPGWPQ